MLGFRTKLKRSPSYGAAIFVSGANENSVSFNDERFVGFDKNFRLNFCH
jgi:hypothetical protein